MHCITQANDPQTTTNRKLKEGKIDTLSVRFPGFAPTLSMYRSKFCPLIRGVFETLFTVSDKNDLLERQEFVGRVLCCLSSFVYSKQWNRTFNYISCTFPRLDQIIPFPDPLPLWQAWKASLHKTSNLQFLDFLYLYMTTNPSTSEPSLQKPGPNAW